MSLQRFVPHYGYCPNIILYEVSLRESFIENTAAFNKVSVDFS
jgi:hypothetical protein